MMMMVVVVNDNGDGDDCGETTDMNRLGES